MSLSIAQIKLLNTYFENIGGTYTDVKFGTVLGGWKAMDLVGSNGDLDNANQAWASYQGIEAAFKAGGQTNVAGFKQAVSQILQAHMHHPPTILHAVEGVVGKVPLIGHLAQKTMVAAIKVGGVVYKTGMLVTKIPGFSIALNAVAIAIPGVDVAAAAYDAIEVAQKVGGMVSAASQLVGAAQGVVSATLGSAGVQGFQAAAGAMGQAGMGVPQMTALLNALPPGAAQAGFHAAVALNTGSVGPTPPSSLSVAGQAGWMITQGAAANGKPSALAAVTGHPAALQGASMAAAALNAKHASWWHRLLVKLHLTKDVAVQPAALQDSPAVAGK